MYLNSARLHEMLHCYLILFNTMYLNSARLHEMLQLLLWREDRVGARLDDAVEQVCKARCRELELLSE